MRKNIEITYKRRNALLRKGDSIVKVEKCKPRGCFFREMCVIEQVSYSPFAVKGWWFNLDTCELDKRPFSHNIDDYDKNVFDLRKPTAMEIKLFKNVAKPLMVLRRL